MLTEELRSAIYHGTHTLLEAILLQNGVKKSDLVISYNN